jgi:hypothetical protein
MGWHCLFTGGLMLLLKPPERQLPLSGHHTSEREENPFDSRLMSDMANYNSYHFVQFSEHKQP